MKTAKILPVVFLVLASCTAQSKDHDNIDDAGTGSNNNQQEFPDKEAVWQEGLDPGVNWGIAADYADDRDIANHPAVYAAEDFEAGETLIPTGENRLANQLEIVQWMAIHN